MKYKLSANSKSVLNSGLTDDYKKAIVEYIWNGFDAGASCVEIRYSHNTLGGVDDLWIIDNGSGINHSNIQSTFGTFLDSNKAQTYQRSSDVRGRKGKGRFSYNVISGGASWKTRYKDDEGVLKEYEIQIDSSNRAEFDVSEPEIVTDDRKLTGTVVHFLDMRSNLVEDNLTSSSFTNYLSSEFAWFLLLNQSKKYCIKIDGVELDYRSIIGEEEEQSIVVGDFSFKCNFIRWKSKISDKYYYYLLNSNLREVMKELTSFNNKVTSFHHSLYVTSSYFNNFTCDKEPGARLDGLVNQSDEIYKKLMKTLREVLAKKEKEFIRKVGANELIAQYERDGILPVFSDDKYGRSRKKILLTQFKVFTQFSLRYSKNSQQSKEKQWLVS